MAVKQTKRKAFSFMRSYFDVLNEIPNKEDKLDFLMSIINKQFLNEDPKELNFITNLCYESQRHAVEKSVKGWITASGTDLMGNPITVDTPPPTPPEGVPPTPPKQEEQVEEEVEEQEEEKSLYYKSAKEFLEDWNTARVKILKVKESNMTKLTTQENTEFNLLKDNFTIDQFKNGMRGLLKQKDMYPSNILRPKHFLSDMNIEKYIDAFVNESQLYENKNKYDVKL